MYSGTTFHSKSGNVAGVHQRVDRLSRKVVASHVDKTFPTIREILHFEGKNGPDGIKRKQPGVDEPWHFIDPHDPGDAKLLTMIDDHGENLRAALQAGNRERAAFEAAWLAHAITDGLTPAHHYPLEDKLETLRGEGLETRTSTRKKIVLSGKNRRHTLRNNWEFWGAKGVMTSHLGFEMGVAAAIAAQPLRNLELDTAQRSDFQPFRDIYVDALAQITTLGMYENYLKRGWTRKLARQAREELLPLIVRMVALGWYRATLAK